jgi:hypothetical protein
MTWINGTATDYLDMLSQIESEAVAHGWTNKRYTTSGETAPYTAELILEGPGFGAGYEVYIGVRARQDAPNNIFSLEGRGFTFYNAAQVFDNQPNISPPVYCNLWDSAITYWMSISDRRILLVAKCSNTYHSLYLGYFAPFTDPTEYPAPMYIAADGPNIDTFGNTDAFQRSIANPGLGGAYIRDPAGNWITVAVYTNQTFGFNGYGLNNYTIYPYHQGQPTNDNPPGNYTVPLGARFEPNPAVAASLPFFPTYIQAMFNKGGFLGVLEGVFWSPGNTLSAEQEITYGGDTYQLFIAISRSLEQPSQFYAVKEA